MNCDGCLEKLERYVDRELTDQELDEVRGHLARCSPCEDRYQLQVGLKRLVKLSCDQGTAPAHLRAKLVQILF
jgi:mycothiol system anti-sigma-R factor